MQLSEKIAELRKSGGLSQEALAEKLNVSRQAISRWETGTAMPDANNLLQLSKLFRVTTDYLLNDGDQGNDSDRSDGVLLQAKESRSAHLGQVMVYLLAMEVMAVLLQFITVVILQNVFFGFLSFVPFITAITGFEYGYRRNASAATEQASAFRRKFYKTSAWLGLYFPVRFAVRAAASLYPRPYTALLLETIIFALYLGAAVLVNLFIDRNDLSKRQK